MTLEVTVTNGAVFVSNLRGYSEGLQPTVQAALQTVGMRILEDMRSFTPVRTGYLLSTENMEMTDFLAFVIYARAYYAPFVEWGTRRMAPRLFMTRAFELHRDELQYEVANGIENLGWQIFR